MLGITGVYLRIRLSLSNGSPLLKLNISSENASFWACLIKYFSAISMSLDVIALLKVDPLDLDFNQSIDIFNPNTYSSFQTTPIGTPVDVKQSLDRFIRVLN